MKLRCAYCGRPTDPFVMLGREAIGPKCAQRMGLTPRKAPKGSALKFVARRPPVKRPVNLDLFDDHENDADAQAARAT